MRKHTAAKSYSRPVTRREKTVTLLISPASEHQRRILRGINDYARQKTRWSLAYNPWRHYRALPDLDTLSKSVGVIATGPTPEIIEALVEIGLPMVLVGSSWDEKPAGVPNITNDDDAVAGLVVGSFLERGFERFLYVGEPERRFSERRGRAFRDALARVGKSLVEVDVSVHSDQPRERLKAALTDMQPPFGLFVQNDQKAVLVLHICQQLGLAVPDDVAVISVDDEEFMCSIIDPPLSSVRLHAERLGWLSAQALEQLLAGQSVPEVQEIAPLELVVRQSSDVLAVPDPMLASAMHFIRQHACDGIRVHDVLEHVTVSRRWLEMSFRKTFDRTPADEIRRHRIKRAKVLLALGADSMLDVAMRSGFETQASFTVAFKREVGTTPSAYRKRHT